MENKTILTVKNMTVSFTMTYNKWRQKNVTIINDMSFELYENEILAIVGASGSGKSVFAHAIMDILPDNANINSTITYKNKVLDFDTIVKEFTLIPQSVSYLDPLMKMKNQIKLDDNILSKKAENLYPFQCSGGMIRRALSLVADEKEGGVIIADEPTSGLDTQTAIKTLNSLKKLTKQDKSVILITHDIDLAFDIADRIAVFYDGKILETVSAIDFKNGNVNHPYTKALFKALPQNDFISPYNHNID